MVSPCGGCDGRSRDRWSSDCLGMRPSHAGIESVLSGPDAEVVLDPAGIPALLSESLDVPRGEAVRGADLLERLRSGFARFATGWPFRQFAGSPPRL